jgi:L-iditol 2-dehydrogenase
MRAAIFYGPNNIATKQVKLYEYDEDKEMIILRVKSCAICGYDVRVFRNGHHKVTPPIVLGHEICGETIQDIRSFDETILKAGTRVAVSPLIPCLKCIYCYNKQFNLCMNLKEIGSNINGGFAEFLKVPKRTLQIGGIIPIPHDIGNEEAALLEPLSCCLNGLSRLGVTKESGADTSSIGIIGDGPIGLIHLQLCKLIGAKTVVIGKVLPRIQKAKAMGADAVILAKDNETKDIAEEVSQVTDGLGVNAVIVATSNPAALNTATSIASKNSKINIFAGMPKGSILSIDPNFLHYNQVTITGSFSATPHALRQAIRLVANKEVCLSEIISHEYPLSHIQDAIFATENYRGLRIVINEF